MFSNEFYWGVISFYLAIAIVGSLLLFDVWQSLSPLWTRFENEYDSILQDPEVTSTQEGHPHPQASAPSRKRQKALHKSLRLEFHSLLWVAFGYLAISTTNRPFMVVEGGFNVECSQYDSLLFLGHVLVSVITLYHTIAFTLPMLLPSKYQDVDILNAILSLLRILGTMTALLGTLSIAAVGRSRYQAIRTCSETGMVQSDVSFGFYIALCVMSTMGVAYILYLATYFNNWHESSTWAHLFGHHQEQSAVVSASVQSTFRNNLLDILDHHYGGHYKLFLGVQSIFSISETIILLHDTVIYSIRSHFLAPGSVPPIPSMAIRGWLDGILLLWILYHVFLYLDRLYETHYRTEAQDILTGEELLCWINMKLTDCAPEGELSGLPKSGKTGHIDDKRNKRNRRKGLLEYILCCPFDLVRHLCPLGLIGLL